MSDAERISARVAEPGWRNGKSARAFRTTGEVAEALDLPAHVLRFWESKFPQIQPVKRSGGRRYYRPQDVDLLRRIRECLYQEGYTIRGVQKLLRDGVVAAEEPAVSITGDRVLPTLYTLRPDADMAGPATDPAPSRRTLREALDAVRAELLEIRALLDELIRS